ncbi:MAG: ATP-dependent Clp protease adaptor ClpS [Planctomycetota bacterium]
MTEPPGNLGAVNAPPNATMRPRLATDPSTVAEPKTKTSLARPWNVIAHDDPVTLQEYVTMVFQRIFGFSYAKAHSLMLEVHNDGCSVVWTGAHEAAELFVQKLHSHQLLATMERVED